MDGEQEMAKDCFGYGRWDAPFWFIGPEQGMSNDPDEMAFRLEAWRKGGKLELDDSICFHRRLDNLRPPKRNKYGKRVADWFGEAPNTQKTWSRLIQFLIGFGAQGVTNHLQYQRDHWGTHAGQACVAELSGLAANNFAVKRDRLEFLSARLARLSEALNGRQEFVLLYGKTPACEAAWKYLKREADALGRCSRGEEVYQKGATLFVHSRLHPAGNGQSYQTWNRFGKQVKALQPSALRGLGDSNVCFGR
jgi:hypothetical protein